MKSLLSKLSRSKILGMLIILSVFLILGFFIRSLILTDTNGSTGAGANTNQELIMDYDDGVIDEESSPESLSQLQGPIKYKVPNLIEKRLDIEAFDQALIEYLTNEGILLTGSEEGNTTDILTAKSDNMVTEDVKNNVFYFDLSLDDPDRTNVTVAVGADGEYSFQTY